MKRILFLILLFIFIQYNINEAKADIYINLTGTNNISSDTYLHNFSGNENTNYGNLDQLQLNCCNNNPVGSHRHGLIRFKSKPYYVPNHVLSNATLSLYYYYNSDIAILGRTYTAYGVWTNRSDVWEELQATSNIYKSAFSWTTQLGDYNTTPNSSITIPANFGYITWSQVAKIISDAQNASVNVTFLISDESPDPGGSIVSKFTTKENTTTLYYSMLNITYSNSLPSVPNISVPINNSRQYNNSINSTWNTSTDADGDTTIYDSWLSSQPDFSNTINRTNFSSNYTGNITTNDGVTYFGKVRSYDGYEFSNWSNVTQFTENTAPSVVNITLLPASPSGTDNLTISMNGTDAEGDPFTKHYLWYKNGVLNTTWNDSTYLNYTGNYTLGDSLYVLGYLNDGYENGSNLQSNTVIIGSSNSAPVLPGISLNPATRKYNKTINVSTSNPITDAESSMVRLQVYRYVSGVKSYLGNSSWVSPSGTYVSITIPYSDGLAHTIYAQAVDNGNATQDPNTNLTSSEVTAAFTSDITAPTVASSGVTPASVTTGGTVIINATADGKGANISMANVTIILPSLASVTLPMTCTYTGGDISDCTRSYTTTSAGTYSIASFTLTDDSGNTATPASLLTFTATAPVVPSTGGGSTVIVVQTTTPNASEVVPILGLRNLTSEGATAPQLQEIADCLTKSLLLQNKCSRYNYGVVVDVVNWWWIFSGGFFAAGIIVIGRGIYQDKQREWFTEPILYATVSTLFIIVLVSGGGFNLYIFNYLFNSSNYSYTFASTALWGGLIALLWDEYSYGSKKTFKILGRT